MDNPAAGGLVFLPRPTNPFSNCKARGGGYSLKRPIRGRAAGQGMAFGLSVLNRVYNFMRVCNKQEVTSPAHACSG